MRPVEVGLAVAGGRHARAAARRSARSPHGGPVARSTSASTTSRSRSSRPPRISGEPPPATPAPPRGPVGQQHRREPELRREEAREEGRLLPCAATTSPRSTAVPVRAVRSSRARRDSSARSTAKTSPASTTQKPAMRQANDPSAALRVRERRCTPDGDDEAPPRARRSPTAQRPHVATRRRRGHRSDHAHALYHAVAWPRRLVVIRGACDASPVRAAGALALCWPRPAPLLELQEPLVAA